MLNDEATSKSADAGHSSMANDEHISNADQRAAQDEALCRRNIRLMYAFQLLYGIVWSIAFGPVFDKYLFWLGGGAARGPAIGPHNARNSIVGMTESVSGIASLIFAAPVGFLVDWRPGKRARLLRLAAILSIGVSVLAVIAVLSDLLILTWSVLILLGMFFELSNSASEAIFADSVPRGGRSSFFTTKAVLYTIGSGVGPFLSAFGLYFLGDIWRPYQMKAVIVTGAVLLPLGCIPLYLFQDPPAAQKDDDASTSVAASDGQSPDTSAPAGTSARRFGCLGANSVPYILALSDFVTAVGAGMTVKFFSLFFIEDEHFSPEAICWLSSAYPFVIAVFTKLTERSAKPLGRAQASLLFFSCNVACLVLLSQVQYLPLLLAIYLVRGGFANSNYPINRSILMDFTPSSRRGLWNAVESFTGMTWSGSAFIGGLLSDSHDYRFTFLITALVYATGCLVYSPLLVIVPRKEQQVREVDSVSALGASLQPIPADS